MVTFIIIVVVYLVIGWVRLSLEIHGDPANRTMMVMREQYLQYILTWPLPLLFNTVGARMIEKSKRKHQENQVQQLWDDNYASFRTRFSDDDKAAILAALYHNATNGGDVQVLPAALNHINDIAAILDYQFSKEYFDTIFKEKDRTAAALINNLKRMSEPNKEFFCTVLIGLFDGLDKPDAFKSGMARSLLMNIGIDDRRREAIIKQNEDDARRHGLL